MVCVSWNAIVDTTKVRISILLLSFDSLSSLFITLTELSALFPFRIVRTHGSINVPPFA